MSAADVNIVVYHEAGGQPLGFRNPLNAWDYMKATVASEGGRVLAESANGHFIVSTHTAFDDFNQWYHNG